jgi:hypothetical protein
MLPNSVGTPCGTRTYTPSVFSRMRYVRSCCYRLLSFVRFNPSLLFANCYLYTPNYVLF